MIQSKHYGSYITLLAAISLLSCEKAPDAAQSSGAGNPAVQTQPTGQSEAEIPANTVLWVQLQKDLDGSKLKTGDHFSGEVAEDVIWNGKPVVPKGSTVKGRVTNSQTANSPGSAGLLTLVVDGVTVRATTYNVSTNPVTLQASPLQPNASAKDGSPVVKANENAYMPKHGVLQFYLASPVRVKN